jgi:kynureninase
LSDPPAVRLFGPGLNDTEQFALERDREDPLADFRDRFELPASADGNPLVYLVGNSLGPLPRASREAVATVLDGWSREGVDGWFTPPDPWYELDDRFLEPLAELVGAKPHEVAVSNGLTVNLHLLLATFFRPVGARSKILIDAPCFPSDRFVVETQLRWHGLDPAEHLIEVGPQPGSSVVEEERLEELLAERGAEIAIFLLGGVNFLTGQRFDLERLAAATRASGARFGVDLAHGFANVPLRLHEWDVDFAAWCHYKYGNCGPGAPAGLFVHERHLTGDPLPRLGGWWGNDPDTRFRMQLEPDFVPRGDAAGWQLSCPSALAMAPLGPAFEMLVEAGTERLREKSIRLTALLEWLLHRWLPAADSENGWELLTPSEPGRRGAQLSLRIGHDAKGVRSRMQQSGVVADFREPDVVRLAPAPLFNSYHDVWRAAISIRKAMEASCDG